MASLWCRPVSVPGFFNLDIAIVLLHLRVHYWRLRAIKVKLEVKLSKKYL